MLHVAVSVYRHSLVTACPPETVVFEVTQDEEPYAFVVAVTGITDVEYMAHWKARLLSPRSTVLAGGP
jgi:hypothetical protein